MKERSVFERAFVSIAFGMVFFPLLPVYLTALLSQGLSGLILQGLYSLRALALGLCREYEAWKTPKVFEGAA
jgi:uncharacterized protein YqhQ